MSKFRLSEDEIMNLNDIIDTDGIKVVLKMLDALVQALGKDVLDEDINKKSFSELAVTKSKYDGAKLLCNRLHKEIENMKGDKNGRK